MRDMLETLIWLMDKGEGLEQKSNDWESSKKSHRLGAYKKILRKAMSWNLPSLKDKLKRNGKRRPINSKRGKTVFNWEKTINAKSQH